jgi:hypothetical protein
MTANSWAVGSLGDVAQPVQMARTDRMSLTLSAEALCEFVPCINIIEIWMKLGMIVVPLQCPPLLGRNNTIVGGCWVLPRVQLMLWPTVSRPIRLMELTLRFWHFWNSAGTSEVSHRIWYLERYRLRAVLLRSPFQFCLLGRNHQWLPRHFRILATRSPRFWKATAN